MPLNMQTLLDRLKGSLVSFVFLFLLPLLKALLLLLILRLLGLRGASLSAHVHGACH